MIQSTQRKMPRLIIQTKRKYKKIEKQDIEPKEEKKMLTSPKFVALMTKATMVRAQSKDDVDSEVTFEEDSDEEMDTIEIEEEDWIEYIERSTADAMEKMAHAKIRCWNRTKKK